MVLEVCKLSLLSFLAAMVALLVAVYLWYMHAFPFGVLSQKSKTKLENMH